MVIVQGRSKRKPTGGRYKSKITKRLSRAGSKPILTKIGEIKKKIVKTIGGNKKTKIVQANTINAYDPKSKKYVKAKIETVMSNPANRHYVRRNIITKGTIVKTDKGPVKITSRPGQEASLSGVLVSN
jgi:small subunit ribosomal protein S8e